MKAFGVPVLLCCAGLMACKTSHFRSQAPEGVTAAIEKTEAEIPVVPVPPVPPGVDTVGIETSTSELQLNQSCEKPVQLLSMVVKVNFRSVGTCEFGVAPNLAILPDHVQARKITPGVLPLPENSEICSMNLESPVDAKLTYDDFIILTIDDFVIFSSNKDLVTNLSQMNNFYKWDFAKVVGSLIKDFKAAPFCIGSAEHCKLPVTDTPGPVLLKLNYAEISGITKAIQGKASVPINLIATGDNDVAKDCFHEPLDLSITMNYIKKPKK